VTPIKPATPDEARAVGLIAGAQRVRDAAAGIERKLWAVRYELPDGEHVLKHGGSLTLEDATHALFLWLHANPECRAIGPVRQMTAAEIEEEERQIRAKYPRRKTLPELTRGQPLRVFKEPWLVPGSKQKPPRTVKATLAAIAGGWGDKGSW
jgi:hypothetical protein